MHRLATIHERDQQTNNVMTCMVYRIMRLSLCGNTFTLQYVYLYSIYHQFLSQFSGFWSCVYWL